MSAELIGEEIRKLRKSREVTGVDLADRMGCSQGTISRVERGRIRPSLDFIESFVRALRLSRDESVRLRGLTANYLLDSVSWDSSPKDQFGDLQKMVRTSEHSCKLVRNFQWMIIPGLLQTRAYCEGMYRCFGEKGLGLKRAVDERLKRQKILRDKKRRFVFVLHENVFWVHFFDRKVLSEQIDTLRTLSGRSNITLKILPRGSLLEHLPPTGFAVYDDTFVFVDSYTRTLRIWDASEVGRYIDLFRSVSEKALGGRDAGTLLSHVQEQIESGDSVGPVTAWG